MPANKPAFVTFEIMTALITQSNYIPWKGYFDNIAFADIFVIYDDVQYTKRDWRNRNLIKSPNGVQWLSIPVEVSGKFHQKINETIVADRQWNKKHLLRLKEVYSASDFYNEVIPWVEEMYCTIPSQNLSEINYHFIEKILEFLNLSVKVMFSSNFEKTGNATERLISICEHLNADKYITGPAAKNYLEENLFTKKEIKIIYSDYSGYPEYKQPYLPFVHGVSILDLIFNTGPNAKNFMKIQPSHQNISKKL